MAEVFWRRLADQEPRSLDRRRSAANRVTEVLTDFALVVANETELAAACTVALLVDDPEVHELRQRIGRTLHVRLVEALDDDAGPDAVRALELTISGALIEVGTGHLAYDDLPGLVSRTAELVVGGGPR